MEGSGYFLVNSSEDDIVNITYLEAESAIEVSMLGMFGCGEKPEFKFSV